MPSLSVTYLHLFDIVRLSNVLQAEYRAFEGRRCGSHFVDVWGIHRVDDTELVHLSEEDGMLSWIRP